MCSLACGDPSQAIPCDTISNRTKNCISLSSPRRGIRRISNCICCSCAHRYPPKPIPRYPTAYSACKGIWANCGPIGSIRRSSNCSCCSLPYCDIDRTIPSNTISSRCKNTRAIYGCRPCLAIRRRGNRGCTLSYCDPLRTRPYHSVSCHAEEARSCTCRPGQPIRRGCDSCRPFSHSHIQRAIPRNLSTTSSKWRRDRCPGSTIIRNSKDICSFSSCDPLCSCPYGCIGRCCKYRLAESQPLNAIF